MEIVHPDDRAVVQREVTAALSHGLKLHLHRRLRMADGHYERVRTVGLPTFFDRRFDGYHLHHEILQHAPKPKPATVLYMEHRWPMRIAYRLVESLEGAASETA